MAFQDLPIKSKVMSVIMLTSISALTLTSVAFMVYDLVTFRRAVIGHLQTLASLTADNSTAPLAFKSEKEGRETLASLHADSHILTAALYDEEGRLFVRYPPEQPFSDFPLQAAAPGHYKSGGYRLFFVPVVREEKRLGTLYMKADLGAVYARFRLYLGIAILVMAGSGLLALAISNALQRRITEPILALAEAAQRVSERNDYSVRAEKLSRDELGVLTDAFNLMLRRIEDQTIALRQNEEQLRLALSASRTGTWDWNVRTDKISWDDHNAALFGLKPADFTGTYESFLNLIHPEDRISVAHHITEALEKRNEMNMEFRVVWPDQSVHHLASRGRALYDPQGQPIRLTGVTADITERKQAENLRSFLAAIIESSDDAVVGKDLESRVVSWNAGAERMFGYSAAEMIGQPISLLLSPTRPQEEAQLLHDVRRGSIHHLETVRLHKDGHPIDVSLTVSPIRNTRGQIIGMSSVARDITERKQAESVLERQSAVLREQAQLLDLANVLARDLEDRIILWNTGIEKMYGWSRADALGRVSHELLRSEFSQPIDSIRQTLFKEGRWEGEVVHTRKDGRRLFVASQWVLYRDEQGKPVAILEGNNDVTERKAAEQQILQMNVDLEKRVQDRTSELTAANRELEAFTYSVAHDLRAPLRHIDAFSKILSDDFSQILPAEARRFLENIRHGSRNMSRLVDDLLNLARIGRQELKRQPVALGALVEEVMVDIKRETEGRAIEWRIHRLPIVQCDSGLMKQVLANLLSNAVKYTRPRPLAVIEIGQEKSNGSCAVFIRDNGVGFNMKYADKLFGVFQRLHRSEDFEGTGVGLATVERIVRKHGGSIWAEAALDHGATFYFTMPGMEKPEGKAEV
jgi:PAS domain S-box-containing protein